MAGRGQGHQVEVVRVRLQESSLEDGQLLAMPSNIRSGLVQIRDRWAPWGTIKTSSPTKHSGGSDPILRRSA